MHTIHYASSRREIWRWYWRSWAKPNGLWLFHVLIAVLIAISVTLRDFSAKRFAVVGAVAFVLCVVLLSLWPQLKFKPAVRSLTIDPLGIKTTIGKLSASRTWAEISTIEDRGEDILFFGRNRNAFIIPIRAFIDVTNRREFLNDANRWHSQSAA
jgi:hypothetical protein